MPPAAASMPAASAASQVPAAIPFRRDAQEVPFPFAGATLLLVLLALAVWAWWAGQRGGAKWTRLGSFKWGGVAAASPSDSDEIRVIASTRLDMNTRLHSVEWQGGRLLVAVNTASPPVVLDRRAPQLPESGEVAP